MFRRAFALLTGTIALPLALAACGGSAPGPLSRPFGGPAVSTTAPPGHAVAILVPLSGPNADRGQAMVHAAQLALDQPGSPPLDVRDTGGTPQGAAAAASAAIGAGAGIIIGPLTSAETAAVAAPARQAGVAVLAFTSDPAQAQPGVWTLGLTPAQQVRRLVGAATAQGKTRFAALLPSNEFGNAMASALTQATASAGAGAPNIRKYESSNAAISAAVRDISDYANRRGPLDAKIREARKRHDAEGRKEAADLSREPIPPPPFDNLLLADTGERLAWLSSFLPYYDIGAPTVRVMGPALWASPAARSGADLNGAWYAAPDPAARTSFDQKFQEKFSTPAPGLADLAYDAASIARVLAGSDGWSAASLTRPEGFTGVDGLLALQPDGTVRRGLALFEIQRGGPVIVEPAPDTMSAPGI